MRNDLVDGAFEFYWLIMGIQEFNIGFYQWEGVNGGFILLLVVACSPVNVDFFLWVVEEFLVEVFLPVLNLVNALDGLVCFYHDSLRLTIFLPPIILHILSIISLTD